MFFSLSPSRPVSLVPARLATPARAAPAHTNLVFLPPDTYARPTTSPYKTLFQYHLLLSFVNVLGMRMDPDMLPKMVDLLWQHTYGPSRSARGGLGVSEELLCINYNA